MRYPACVEQDPDGTPPDRPGSLIGAVDNVLRLLRLFEDHEMIRVNQVARDMGLSRSTVHRMLATLSHHQFVEQDEHSRAYRPGPALVDIGLAVVSKIDIRAVSHTALVEPARPDRRDRPPGRHARRYERPVPGQRRE